MNIIYCRGNDPDAPRIAKRSKMFYGIRHDHKPYSSDIYMLDINWEKYIWSDYIQKVYRYRPVIAMVPDYENKDQRESLLARIHEVRECGVTHVLVCPKFVGAVSDIPNSCIVAVSVPTDYAGFLPDPIEVAGKRLHLLGGQPDQQLYLIRDKYRHSTVVSVDGNKTARKAGLGQFWSATKPGWRQTPSRRYSSYILELYSCINTVRYLNNPSSVIKMNGPVAKCMSEEERKKYGFRDIIPCCPTE